MQEQQTVTEEIAPPAPFEMIRPGRPITGMSAILLPFTEQRAVDWSGFEAHLARTADAGLTPAVNMDTGYVNLLDGETQRTVLRRTRETLGGAPFVAGAYVADEPGDALDLDAYRRAIDQVRKQGGTPIIFQSYGLAEADDVVEAYAQLGRHASEFIAFELGKMFAPFGEIYDLDTYAGLMEIPECLGAKHSSLSRTLEWQRLELRDRKRPDFKVLTGNDLAIDMVMYGSDYLLGLSTFAPELFAERDRLWEREDPLFYELNDGLQYLGFFAFRAPVPAYKHSAAQFLKLRGQLGSSAPHPQGTRRPESDVPVLREIAEYLEEKAAQGAERSEQAAP